MGYKKIQTFRFGMDPGVMAMKRYFVFPKSPEPKLHHRVQFRVRPRIDFCWMISSSSIGDTPRIFLSSSTK